VNLRRNIVLLVLSATILPVIVGLLAVVGASPIEDSNRQDEQLAYTMAHLITSDLTSTAHTFRLGAELFELGELSKEETTGVLRMLYKQEEDVDVVVLLDEENEAVIDPVFLRQEQIVTGTPTEKRLPVNESDLAIFLGHLPFEVARESMRAFSDPYVNERKNEIMVAGVVTVAVSEGTQTFVIGFERSLRRIRRLMASQLTESGYKMFVVDGGGRLVMHPDGDRSLKREKMTSHPLVREFTRGGEASRMHWENENGEMKAGAVARLDFLDWAVVVEHELLPLRALGWRLPLWSWFAWGIVAIIILFEVLRLERGVRRILGEMQRLRDNAEHRAEEIKRLQASILESGKLSAIGELGAGVAHELNNPVGGILGLTQLMLRKKSEDDSDRKFLQRIENEARRCKVITDNLLRFSEHQGVDHREPLRLDRVLTASLDLLSSKLEGQRIEILKDFDDEAGRVMGNEGQLQRAVLNVLLNAETAMPEGGKLVLSTGREGDWVVMKVSDSGRGIPQENIEHVFEPFFTTKDNWKGAGLGLSEVYQIVTEHGGKVNVESEETQGTVVTMLFPRLDGDEKSQAKSPVPLA